MMNAAAPAIRSEGLSSSSSFFKPIDLSPDSSLEEPMLSPLAIFRDGESGATGMHLMRRANPIDSMDCSQNDSSCYEEDLIWTDSHQRVISPYPVDSEEDLPQTDSWKDTAVEAVDFSHFFPSAHVGVMECDDFSLSSASGQDLVLDDDLSNPESFWDSASNLDESRSPSPAQVSIGSTNSNSLFPPSPTSTAQVHELEIPKSRLMPC